MYGATMGTFRVLYSSNGGTFSGGYLDEPGNQGTEWIDAAVTLPSAIDARVSINIFSINTVSGMWDKYSYPASDKNLYNASRELSFLN